MPKKATKNMPLSDKNNEGVYFTELKITDLKCFHGENTINLTSKNGDFAQWTVILGNNNTGKTTILKSLAILDLDNHEWRQPEKNELLSQKEQFQYYLDFFKNFLPISEILHYKSNEKVITLEYIKDMEIDRGILFTLKNSNTFSIKGRTKTYNIDRIEKEKRKLKIYAYGTLRSVDTSIKDDSYGKDDTTLSLLHNKSIMNCEEWLKELYLSEKLGNENAGKALAKIKTLLTSGILPDVHDFTIKSIPKGNTGVDNFIEFTTDYGAVRFRELGYGYQSMTAWVLDLVRRMMERYPNAENPLAQPAVVLVDEIDLHLHPEWQREIVGFLSHHFPKTQFIVTAHSPLIVQSAESVNVVLLEKQGDKTVITQPETQNFTGWSVEEIMDEIMGMQERVHSDKYIALTKAFDIALANEDGKSRI